MKRAVVFAGQGAQFVGMGKDLAGVHPECKALYDQADSVLGYSLSRICFEGPADELTRSNHCQPAIFVTSIACWTALRKSVPGISFSVGAGLSLGEWSALHMAGVLSFEDTLRVLEARGRFMQEACEERQGGMVSVIGLPAGQLGKVCSEAGVEISNFNSPEQVVLSGPSPAVAKAAELAKAAGAAKTVVLNVAGAYHSSLMLSAAKRLDEFLGRIAFSRTAMMPVVSNVTGMPHGSAGEMKQTMVRQVTSPVRWADCVKWMKDSGVTEYVECGPGKILSGLIKRIDSQALLHNIQDLPSLGKEVESLKG